MNGVKDKIWFLREGLFAKYVIALVGLVVFVLAVNGAMETWISYRGIKSTLTDAMSEKAEATAKRIEQSMSDLERQISWVTRAFPTKIEQRRADYAAAAEPGAAGQPALPDHGQGRETLRLSRQSLLWQHAGFFPRCHLHPKPSPAAPVLRRPISVTIAPFMSIAVAHSGFNAGVTVAEIDLRFLSDFLGDAQVGKTTFAYVVDPRGQVLASSTKGPEIGKDLSGLPQVAALLRPDGAPWPPAPMPTAIRC